LLFFDVNGTSVGQFVNRGTAAGWARYKLFFGLLLKVFVTWEPTFKAMLLFTY
jgi:hypothetical protein